MSQAQQQFAELATGQIETVLRFARLSLDSSERLFKVQVEATRTALEENVKNARALLSVKDAQEAVSLRQKLIESSVEQATTFSRAIFEIASQAQGELSKLYEERAVAFNKELVSSLDRVAKSAPAGADVAVAAVKSTAQATAAAVDSLTKAAKQVAEFTDASVKAATNATAEAVKTASRKTAA
ncbi:phasin family protein [Silvimonas amylolytica]|uniref:Phasin family protein n=1 Tax=Silvimonas amylolytica TaxID=449663 RepID=A0ABQ2PMC9_9NEIS|nr:phasin family protein [Silvimonas amylolytica]GGP26385.1 phasin family protein [Silvimonas amylolytica]